MKLLAARDTAVPVTVEVDVQRLYVETGGQVRSALRRLTDGRDVEDLLQEVFVVALGRRRELERAQSARAWLLGVAVKVAAGHRRKARFRGWLGLDRAPEPASQVTPERTAEQHEAERWVHQGLLALSPRKREVFVLFELEGLTGQEIAAAVGCPVKTVWTRLFHARRDFAAALRELGVADE